MMNRFQMLLSMGSQPAPLYPGKIYAEEDPVGPVNIYGSSKLAGEVAVGSVGGHSGLQIVGTPGLVQIGSFTTIAVIVW